MARNADSIRGRAQDLSTIPSPLTGAETMSEKRSHGFRADMRPRERLAANHESASAVRS
jgi:hypothetical protein